MKKRLPLFILVTILAFVILFFTNDKIDSALSNALIKSAKINYDSDFQRYEELSDLGQLENGFYNEELGAVEAEHSQQIRITFARNNNIDINYFYDKEHKELINENSCWLNPGDIIFVEEGTINNISGELYSLSGFMLMEFDADGKKVKEYPVSNNQQDILIPSDFTGAELSIIPLGKFIPRTLYFNDYYFDDNNEISEKKCPDGEWYVNGEKCSGNSTEMNPTETYEIQYRFSPEEYYFLISEPENDNNASDIENGIVSFYSSCLNKSVDSFNVELHRYYNGKITVDTKSAISFENTIKKESPSSQSEKIKVSSKKSEIDYHLKAGEELLIESSVELKFENYTPLNIKEEKTNDNSYPYKYIFTAPSSKRNTFVFDPNAYSFKHGDIIFSYQGKDITSKTILYDGSRLSYRAENVENGYWLPDGNHSLVIDIKNADKDIKNIKLFPYKKVSVHLPQPNKGGRIMYSHNGDALTANVVELYCGSVIDLKYDNWHGWEPRTSNSHYTVTESSDQILSVDNQIIDNIFRESNDRKPSLTVKLDKSVGKSLNFNVTYYIDDNPQSVSGKYEEKKLDINGEKIVDNKKIDTYYGVKIETKNGTISSTKALKFNVTMTNRENEKLVTNDIQYLKEVPGEYIFYIYRQEEFATTNTDYSSVEIEISLVDVLKYTPKSISNGSVVVSLDDTRVKSILKQGDILDESRKVSFEIVPSKGYVVSGKNVTNGKYKQVMEYSKFESDFDKIVSKHTIFKTYYVTLDTSDDYGTVKYYLEKDPVSGRIPVHNGQTIEIEYEITDGKHSISYNDTGISAITNIVKSKTKTKSEIIVSDSLDGKTITRKDYINIK